MLLQKNKSSLYTIREYTRGQVIAHGLDFFGAGDDSVFRWSENGNDDQKWYVFYLGNHQYGIETKNKLSHLWTFQDERPNRLKTARTNPDGQPSEEQKFNIVNMITSGGVDRYNVEFNDYRISVYSKDDGGHSLTFKSRNKIDEYNQFSFSPIDEKIAPQPKDGTHQYGNIERPDTDLSRTESEKYFIGEEYISSQFINVPQINASRLRQSEEFPFFKIQLHQYWRKDTDKDIAGRGSDGEIIIQYRGMEESHIKRIEETASWMVGGGIQVGDPKTASDIDQDRRGVLIQLEASYKNETKKLKEEINQASGYEEIEIKITRTENGEPYRFVSWSLVDEYTLFGIPRGDFQKPQPIQNWTVRNVTPDAFRTVAPITPGAFGHSYASRSCC